ncbi:hypothetical protein ACPA9J_12955 [Pseudomonas aeruginosa]
MTSRRPPALPRLVRRTCNSGSFPCPRRPKIRISRVRREILAFHDSCPSASREHGPGAKRVPPLLFLTCLLDAAGVGLIVPLLPTLIGSVAPLAVRDARHLGRRPGMTFAPLQLFFRRSSAASATASDAAPSWSLAMLGFALSYLLLALADSLWMLFLGRALAGLHRRQRGHRDGLRG